MHLTILSWSSDSASLHNFGGMRSMRKSSIIDNIADIAYVNNIAALSRQTSRLLGLVLSVICERVPLTADIAATYKDDLPTPYLLEEEMHRWQHRYQDKKPHECPDSCAKAIKVCGEDTVINMHVLLQLTCTIPVTSGECERSAQVL